jgi:phosphomethylpyrimidine synthase
MEITREIREYAAKKGITADNALKEGMDEKSDEFLEKGAEVYVKAD